MDLSLRERKKKPAFFDSELAEMPHVVSFSGGRTSGFMLRKLLDAGLKPIILFANTGKERDETLDFVHEVETQWGVDVTWLEYCRVPASQIDLSIYPTERRRQYVAKEAAEGCDAHWFKVVDYETAAREQDRHTPFDELLEWMSVLPNTRARACTNQMKIMTKVRYLWSQGIHKFVNHIGIRSDESDRAVDMVGAKDRIWDILLSFPLNAHGFTETDVMAYWKASPFDLQLKSYEGNCTLCFLKKRGKKIRLIQERPESVDWWKAWEKRKRTEGVGKNGSRFRAENGHEYAVLEAFAKHPEACEAVGISLEMDDDTETMECACTSGAMNFTEADV